MGGKATLLVLLGFSLIFLAKETNFYSMGNTAATNAAEYYLLETSNNAANSVANIAISEISRNPLWRLGEGFTSELFGTETYAAVNLGADSTERRITVNSRMTNGLIGIDDQMKHLGKTVEIKLTTPSFAEYGYFSNREKATPLSANIWWTKRDSVFGRFHTNGNLNVSNHPYFDGPTTTFSGKTNYRNNYATDYPYTSGTIVGGKTKPFPTNAIADISQKAKKGGKYLSAVDLKESNGELTLKFLGDKVQYQLSPTSPVVTELITDFAPNGVFYADSVNLRVSGTFVGQLTISAGKKLVSGSTTVYNGGNVFIDDDLTYKYPPDFNDPYDPSTDVLGIVADKDVIIATNDKTKTGVEIHASLFCANGGITAEKIDATNIGARGTLKLKGSVSQELRKIVSYFGSDGEVQEGYEKNYRYDARLRTLSPPSFPMTSTFEISSWLESSRYTDHNIYDVSH